MTERSRDPSDVVVVGMIIGKQLLIFHREKRKAVQ